MAYLVTASSHYPNPCWLLIDEVLWYSPESIFTVNAHATIWYNEFENYTFEITVYRPGANELMPNTGRGTAQNYL